MKEPKKLDIDNGDHWQEGLSLSYLDDTKKAHLMVMQYGELSSISLNKTQVKKVINWLNKWVEFKEQK